ncbi:DUF5343 domain-containing protein [Methylomonas methanica]|uniref:DUF5343 domain-containing protein n=1 Tax=Methylomonas methanica (strain DSM 25384 / MC09) TaxID=857087 RepID=G0A1X9_METMM|nr:DUF5343 domain-containing protein [Methylomonas methanica]AEG01362.1 hypothetical protein Metme_2983 [Methylomonas methanica MC09]
MAEEKKKGYPKIAQANWFGLRDKLKQRVPGEISASYVASAMGMAEGSARANVVSPLKALGIIGEDSKPTDLAYDWRDDTKYPEVCEKIIESIYPQELQDLFHTPDAELSGVTSWFMRDAKVGEPAAKMFASTYIMLLQKKPEDAKDVTKSKAAKPKTSNPQKATEPKKKATEAKSNAANTPNLNPSDTEKTHGFSPRLHIDVQVHISPESSPEQIDKIFESMAKHLKDFKS